jgi:hypothetical protein
MTDDRLNDLATAANRLAELLNELDEQDIDVYPARAGMDWMYALRGADHAIVSLVRLDSNDRWMAE